MKQAEQDSYQTDIKFVNIINQGERPLEMTQNRLLQHQGKHGVDF